MNIPYVMRKCTKCGKWLVASSVNFYKTKGGKYGLESQCKECRKQRMNKYNKTNKEKINKKMRQHYEANKEAYSEKQRQYREQNKEVVAEKSRKRYEAHKEYILEQHRHYKKANKDYIKKHNKQYREANKERHKQWRQSPQGQVILFNIANRRRAKEQAQGRGITKEQWLECMSFFNWQCAYSGEYLGGKDNQSIRSLDHIEPISKGGVNEIWNLVPMYRAYNSSKNDKDLLEWYTEQDFYSTDRLNKIYEWQEYAYNKWGRENITEAE